MAPRPAVVHPKPGLKSKGLQCPVQEQRLGLGARETIHLPLSLGGSGLSFTGQGPCRARGGSPAGRLASSPSLLSLQPSPKVKRRVLSSPPQSRGTKRGASSCLTQAGAGAARGLPAPDGVRLCPQRSRAQPWPAGGRQLLSRGAGRSPEGAAAAKRAGAGPGQRAGKGGGGGGAGLCSRFSMRKLLPRPAAPGAAGRRSSAGEPAASPQRGALPGSMAAPSLSAGHRAPGRPARAGHSCGLLGEPPAPGWKVCPTPSLCPSRPRLPGR